MDHNENRSKVPVIRILLDSAKKRLLPLFLLFLAAVIIRIAVVGIPRLSLTIDIDREELSFVAGRVSALSDYLEVPYAANREELDPLLDGISGRYTYIRTVNAKYGGSPAHIRLVLGDAENNPSESFLFSNFYQGEWLCVGGGDGRVHCYIRDDGNTSFISPLLDYLYENGTPVNLTPP